MSNVARVAATAANSWSGGVNVEDVFSTYLYTGTGAAQTITNNIDLSGEGGLVWGKSRSSGVFDHQLMDTERGIRKVLVSHKTDAEASNGDISAFNSDGFSLSTGNNLMLSNGQEFASWTFRKAPKFFDVVTYTGNGVAGREIAHNLGCNVGAVIIKRTDASYGWPVWHKDTGVNSGYLNSSAAFANWSGHDISATSTTFSMGNDAEVNASGGTYVAYLFAHNDGDGNFGSTADQDIIKCGSYTGNGSTTGPEIDLGFEPQFLIVKNAGASGNWEIFDAMRGLTATGVNDSYLRASSTLAEQGSLEYLHPTPTGFQIDNAGSSANSSGVDYIYIAIRRGPMAVPESATEVFAIDTYGDGVSAPRFKSGFPVDMFFYKTTTGGNNYLADRLRGVKLLKTDSTAAETTSDPTFDYMNGVIDGSGVVANIYGWMWKRAPNFFDVVAYTGNGTAGRTVSHNLGVAPEMIWVKNRIDATSWGVYHKGLNGGTNPADYTLLLNSSIDQLDNAGLWNDTVPTDTVFTVGTAQETNGTNDNMIAYLFASLDGVSKVGSYTGNGSTTGPTVDCGFSAGPRFVLIKRSDGEGQWWIFDTERGLTSGNDPYIFLNLTNASQDGYDLIDPTSSGFQIVTNEVQLNASGGTYIFYAIA